jgi:SAM-dependent methyltransferase
METTWSDDESMKYHLNQYSNPKESTLKFVDFIEEYVNESDLVVDLGAGAGAATHYLSTVYVKTNFKGIDSDSSLIDVARGIQDDYAHGSNISFEVGDFNHLAPFQVYAPAGVVSLQTLSWLPKFDKPMAQVYEVLKPEWIAVSSLFYEGRISAEIVITEHERKRSSYYNVISLNEFSEHAKYFGYKIDKIEKFNLNIDIPKPINSDYMGTYTRLVANESGHERLQISGPLLMSWYFVGLVRSLD